MREVFFLTLHVSFDLGRAVGRANASASAVRVEPRWIPCTRSFLTPTVVFGQSLKPTCNH